MLPLSFFLLGTRPAPVLADLIWGQRSRLPAVVAAVMGGASGNLPHGPQRAQSDAVGHHGDQVHPEEQHVQHVAHLQPLLGHLAAPVSLLQEAAYGPHFLQDVAHDGRGGVPVGGQAQSEQPALSLVLAEPLADLTGVVERALSCRGDKHMNRLG